MLKLHIDFERSSPMRLNMTDETNDGIRDLFAEIGCIMEDASLIALVWDKGDGLDIRTRFQRLSDANKRIAQLLKLIELRD